MDNGFGWGTVGLVAGAFTVVGWLAGEHRAKKKETSRWVEGLLAVAKDGTCAGTDLNEQERVTLFAALKGHAKKLGVDTLEVTKDMAIAARDLLGRAGLHSMIEGKDPEKDRDRQLRNLIFTAAREQGIHEEVTS